MATHQEDFIFVQPFNNQEFIDDIKYNLSFGCYDCKDITKTSKHIILHYSFHCMNDHGYWDGYINFNYKIPILGNQAFYKMAQLVGCGITSNERRKYFDPYMHHDNYLESISYVIEEYFKIRWFNHRTNEIIVQKQPEKIDEDSFGDKIR